MKSIGEIPNILALAHFITSDSFLAEKKGIILFSRAQERKECSEIATLLGNKKIENKEGTVFDIEVLHSSQNILLFDLQTIQKHNIPSPQEYKTALITLQTNTPIDLSFIQKILQKKGFQRESHAMRQGNYAIRGNVIDIYTDALYRIECGELTIEHMWEIDPVSQKNIKKKEQLFIPDHTNTHHSTILDHLYTVKERCYLFGDIQIEENPFGSIHPLHVQDGINAGYTFTKAYHLRYELLQKEMEKKVVHFFSQTPDRLQNIIPHAQTYLYAGLKEGVYHQKSETVLLTDYSVGIREKKQKKRSTRVIEAMLQTITPGDYVVHLFHGIAKFSGMETMHINGRNRDYFVLEYAQKDKIYVPVEMAERIDAYMGESHPTLHRLSSASWNDVVLKIQKETQKMAADLLTLYAQREHAIAPVLTIESDEEKKKEEIVDDDCDFELTPDQQSALQDVFHDIEQTTPMDRLLCGDVGFGKTEVALRAAYRSVLCGYQVLLLAPTTVLAQQHYDTFTKRLQKHDVRIGVLSRLQKKEEQKKIIEKMKNGDIDIVIGTHRLLSSDIVCKKLGFVVIDEEQRFGVQAKETLKKMRAQTHILTMTATPIPRTLHLSLAGVRKISTIMTPPQTRKAVHTIIEPINKKTIKEAIEREIARGGQTYYIYNRVETIELKKAQLQTLLPHIRIGVAHGQLSSSDLTRVMHAFDVGDIDVLLASTIVENGLDIPQANTIIIENASRFGLAQLYQLKGRVGRAERQGYAYFLYTEQKLTGDVQKRFIALEQAHALGSGFELAMKDMEIRGVGNILGKEQHGHATKIGLHLYIRLLNQAMQELEGEEIGIERDIPIELPLEARIPEDVLDTQSDRIALYQKLANIRDEDALKKTRSFYEKKAEFQKNGMLDPSIAGLFDLLEIKLLSARSTLTSIDTQYIGEEKKRARITITTDQELPPLDSAWDVLFQGDYAYRRARVELELLGEHWVDEIKKVVSLLEKKTDTIPAKNPTERIQ